MSITSPKSRGNFKVGACFKSNCASRGKPCEFCIRFSGYTGTRLSMDKIASLPKTKLTLLDQPNMKAVIKIGKEINLFKARDRKRFASNKSLAKEVDNRFKTDTDNIMKPKENTDLNKRMGETYKENYKRELARR